MARARNVESAPRRSRLWWWVVVAFAIQAAVWTAWLSFASRHPVAEVPIVKEVER